MQHLDIAIVGGGIVGLTLALALRDSGKRVAVIEGSQPDFSLASQPELRVSAITGASENVFRQLGVWSQLQDSRLGVFREMEVWEQDSFARIHFSAATEALSHLGHIVENRHLQGALWQAAERADHIRLFTQTRLEGLSVGQREAFLQLSDKQMLSATLVVGADGGNSQVRGLAQLPVTHWDYQQQALVATIKTQRPHGNCARQVFSKDGILAFLPLSDPHQCSIVWSLAGDEASDISQLANADFNKRLSAAFDTRLGICELLSERPVFPLKMRFARQWVGERVALIGDAAHTFHPLAGQGVNLGIMDAAALAQSIDEIDRKGEDIGVARNLRHFERWRKAEAAQLTAAMEGFKRLFAGDNPLKKLVRDLGLVATDKLPGLKGEFIRRAYGLSGELPALARGPRD